MNRPKVSVIIPAYNVEMYLEECLDSVINQTLSDIEIICIDDGSTDHSLDILRKYEAKDSRIKVLQQENKFAGVARNTGMEVATGEYYVFLDSDDFFELDLLEKQYEQCKKMDADVCICGADKYDNIEKKYIKAPYLLNLSVCKGKEVFSSIALGDAAFSLTTSVPWNKIFSARLIKEHSLQFQKLRSANDVYFVLSSIALAKKVTYVDSTLVHYRVGIANNIQSIKAKSPADFCEALVLLKEKLAQERIYESIEKAFVNLALEHCEWNLGTLKTMHFDAYNKLARLIKEKYIYVFDIARRPREYFNDKKKYDSFCIMMQEVKTPKISIAVAVYNVEKYLKECLDSIINQTFKDIEIICVNDGSTDRSGSILNEYKNIDSRIKVIDKKKNEGLLLARKSAVEKATGEYLIFVDSDDYLDLGLCSFINYITQSEKADIIQFCVKVKNYSNDDDKVMWLQKALLPLDKELSNQEILREAYAKRSYSTQLWGKIYKACVCKKAFSALPDVHCFVGEDIFSYFYLAFYANSYKGIISNEYYVYRYGLGVGNSEIMPLEKFELYCKMADWTKYVKKTMITCDVDSVLVESYGGMVKRMSEDCCRIYKSRIRPEEQDKALKLLVEYWKNITLAETIIDKQLEISVREILSGKVPVYKKIASAFNGVVMPKLSVVIPIYNVEDYLEECIDSVQNQTLKEIEIICVNDGSTDNSINIIEKYAKNDNRITIISKKNGGVSSARNAGTSVARGKYIYYLDSDDLIVPDALEKLYNYAEHYNTDILYFGAESFYENHVLEVRHKNYTGYYARKKLFEQAVAGDVMLKKFLDENLFRCHVALQLIRKEFLVDTEILFKEGIIHEDELFSLCLLAKAQRVMCIEDNLYMRRIRDDSIMTSNVTSKNFVGLFVVAMTLGAVAMTDQSYSSIAKDATLLYAERQFDAAKRVYKKLPWSEIQKIPNMLPLEYQFYYKEMRLSLEWKATVSNKSKNRMPDNKELIDIKNSVSYRIGRAITYIPRKVRGGIRCIGDHGLIYTSKLLLKRIRNWIYRK